MATVERESDPKFERLPPQSLEAERCVLGAMLLNPDAVGTAIEVLRDRPEEVFYSERHQFIYAAAVSLYRRNMPIDAVTLVEQLSRDNKLEASGGYTYIGEISGAVPTSANVEYYARIVLDAAILRRIILTCSGLVNQAYGQPEEVSLLLDQAESQIFAIAEQRQLNPIYRIGDLVVDGIERIEKLIKEQGVSGLTTGFRYLDDILGGLQKSDMIVLAARPSVGKTAFALNVASHVATHEKKSVLLFSLEMAKEQLVQRLLCMEGRINSKRLRTGFLAKDEFLKLQPAADKLTNAEIYIDDSGNVGILELRSKAKRHATQKSLDLIIIDYLQLMSGRGKLESRQLEIAEISRSIKGLARQLQIPILALSQLSREAERDEGGTPKLSHLRESGAIEQDADVVMMLSRPAPFKRGRGGEPDDDMDESFDDRKVTLTIAKQRNGPTGSVDLLFDKDIQRFLEPAHGVREPDEAMVQGGNSSFDDDPDDVPF